MSCLQINHNFKFLSIYILLYHFILTNCKAEYSDFSIFNKNQVEKYDKKSDSFGNSVRFCYKGWQEFSDIDCPFGILFNEPVDLECIYATKNSHKFTRLYDEVCNEPYILNQNQEGSEMLSQNLPKVVLIDFSNASTTPLRIVESWIDLNVCYEECEIPDYSSTLLNDEKYQNVLNFQSFNDMSVSSESFEEVPDDGFLSPISDETRKKLVDQTLRLADALFDTLPTLTLSIEEQFKRDNNEKELRVIQIFRQTMGILGKYCKHSYLHKDYINRVMHGFIFLLEDFGTQVVEDVSIEEFEDISSALTLCEKTPHVKFRLNGLICSSKAFVTQIVKIENGQEYVAGVENSSKYVLDKFDLFIESAWRGIDAIHGVCFSTFRPNVNMHHRYARAMESLFRDKIQERWVNPTELEKLTDWGLWFLVDIQSTMNNLQECVKAAYDDAPFTLRLDRPINQNRIRRKKRDNFDFDQSYVMRENSKTFDKISMDKSKNQINDDWSTNFWKKYRKDGGITQKLKEDITCIKSEDEKNGLMSLLRLSCHS